MTRGTAAVATVACHIGDVMLFVAPAHARIAVPKLGTRLNLRETHDGKYGRADKRQPRDVK
jgi:hypothetical protein